MDWIKGIQASLDYIEQHLTSELSPDEIAKSVYISPFHFQRVFSLLSGMSVGEYIRARRMSLAGQALSLTDQKVIDVALRYGYESPESFCKAFTRFHGVSPSQAREPGVTLRMVAPLLFQINLKGGIKMDYRIEKKDEITLLAAVYQVNTESSFKECPKCFDAYIEKGLQQYCAPAIAVCFPEHAKALSFRYAIGDEVAADANVPEGMEKFTLPARTWAAFPAKGALPKSIQDTWQRVYSEWLPTSGYKFAQDAPEMEIYSYGDTSSEDYVCELWLPLEKAE